MYNAKMFYIFGLGNPGKEYENTKHNAGRTALVSIAKKNKFSEWEESKKALATISSGVIEGKKITFVLPNTFMNKSGASVKYFVKTAKDREKILVAYDDLDIPIGKIKMSTNRSSGGHNGLDSVIKNLKSENFGRIRIGISKEKKKGGVIRPDGSKLKDVLVEKNFSMSEAVEFKKSVKKIEEAISLFAQKGFEIAMNKANTN